VNLNSAGCLYARKRVPRGDIGLSNSGGLTTIFLQRRCCWGRALLASVILLLVPGFAAAQGNLVSPRITDRVDEAALTVLQGNTHPLARPQFDQGAAPPNLPMDRIMLVLKRSPDQESALRDLLEQQQVTSAPNYHKWLTPDQFGQQFGPADQDIQVVTAWLTSHGFQSIQVSKGRSVIEFSGTAAQVESALHTAIHKYVVNGEAHWANVNDPQIPTALAPVISGFVSLHNFPKKPMSVRSGKKYPVTVGPGPKPQITFSDGTHGVAPADFNVIYNVGTGMTGAGATIGVVAHSNINVSDVTQFRSLFGLPANDPQVILNGPDPGILTGINEEDEAVLDTTWPGAVAPNATVKLVVSEDTNAGFGADLSEQYIVDNNVADIMTESFGTCEGTTSLPDPTAEVQFYEFLAEQAAAQGITHLVASGDSGPDGCDDPSNPPATLTPASVNLISSTPFTVAVGGTQFNDVANPSAYWNTTNNTTNLGSAISYIPENVWNESVAGSPAASGGGQSIFFTKPSWQSGVAGIPATNSRFVPDVSLTAASHDAYVYCIGGTCQGTNPSVSTISGTSASVQAFGGIMALVFQKTGARQGQANYVFYNLAAKETLASCNGSNTTTPPMISTCIFNDTTTGTTNITGEAGFAAGPGYDEATGLGSVNVSNLVNQWGTAVIKHSATTLLLNGGAAVNITHGASIPVSITVAAKAPDTGTPTGDVSLIAQIPSTSTGQGADGFTLTNGSTATGSTATFLPGSPTPGGSYNVVAHYAGDGTFLGSDSTPVSVIVNPEASQTLVGVFIPSSNSAVASMTYGDPHTLTVQVANSASPVVLCNPKALRGPVCPSGTVTLTDGATPVDAGTFKLNSLGMFEDQPNQLTAGVHSLKAVYSGDNSFNGSTSSTDVVTVAQAMTTTTVAAVPTSVATGGNVTLTATVATTSLATASAQQEPNGMVQFLVNGANFGSPVAVTGGVNSATLFAQATANMSYTTSVNGQYMITAQYNGDNNYAMSAVSAPITVTVGIPGINVSSNTGAVTITTPGQSGTQLITVTGSNIVSADNVTLTCAVTSSPAGTVYFPPTCNMFGTPDLNFAAPNIINLTQANMTGNATMTVSTTPAHATVFRPTSRPVGPNWFLVSEVGAFITCFFLLGISAQKRRGLVLLAMLLFAVLAVGTSCGGYNNPGGGSNPGTTTGTYTVTVTATPQSGGGAAVTTAIMVTVQ
jgi:hypothetical protein